MKSLQKYLWASFLGLALCAKAEEVTIFYDNMESGTNGWTSYGSSDGIQHDGGLWHQQSGVSHSTSNSWFYGFETPFYHYESLENTGELISPSISLAGFTNATLSLFHSLDTENDPAWDYDEFAIYVTDNEGGVTLAYYTQAEEDPNGSNWENLTVDLSAHLGKSINIYFYAYTTSNCGFDCWWEDAPYGWFVDNVKVVGQR